MRANIDSQKLSDVIQQELADWSRRDVVKAVNEAAKETAKEAAVELTKADVYVNRGGGYTEDWTSGVRDKKKSVISGADNYTVYNKKHYQLTHLLEKGHLTRDGGRTRKFEHIGPVNDQVEEKMIKKIEERLSR